MTRFNKYLSMLFMAFTMVALIGCSVASGQKSAGEAVDDTVITTRVKAALIENSEIRAGEINVETFKGEVQLTGFVSSSAAATQAVRLARDVEGVTSVINDMQVR
ncbi:MAG TPA: BON domain-containing protein [Pseudomonas xinjiangensis]|uniref:Osmotically-inducible protein Y n=2 Tax=root TaxID=1 RepID=A0A7V1FSJ6_9GAMM|nr:BON domain-containing protein [Halopseudomonas xinjiangensis]HEC47644.1 BON domain-containing protein [Halopseudomonas xinjiangensis]